MELLRTDVEGRSGTFHVTFANAADYPVVATLAARDDEGRLFFRMEPQTPLLVPAHSETAVAVHVTVRDLEAADEPRSYDIEFRGLQSASSNPSLTETVRRARFTYDPSRAEPRPMPIKWPRRVHVSVAALLFALVALSTVVAARRASLRGPAPAAAPAVAARRTAEASPLYAIHALVRSLTTPSASGTPTAPTVPIAPATPTAPTIPIAPATPVATIATTATIATPVATTLIINPIVVRFTPRDERSGRARQAVHIVNLGPRGLTVGSVAIFGADRGDFTALGGCLGRRIAADDGCVIRIDFRRRGRGARTATLVIADSAPDGPRRVSLRADG